MCGHQASLDMRTKHGADATVTTCGNTRCHSHHVHALLLLWRLYVRLPTLSWPMLCCAQFNERCVVWRLQAAADQEPLALSSVTISPAAVQALTDAWAAVRHQSLCPSPEQLLILVQQVGATVTKKSLLLAVLAGQLRQGCAGCTTGRRMGLL
jgi:hypothetical protein